MNKLTDDIKVVFKYPLLNAFTTYSMKSSTKMIFDINRCIEEVHFNEEITIKLICQKKT